MKRVMVTSLGLCATILLLAKWNPVARFYLPTTGYAASAQNQTNTSSGSSTGVPIFAWDPTWPKELPDGWLVGMIGGLYVDAKDHIWVANRFNTLTALEKEEGKAAPPIIEFDQAGEVIQANAVARGRDNADPDRRPVL